MKKLLILLFLAFGFSQDLTHETPEDTYPELLHIVDGVISDSVKIVYDGDGTPTAISLSRDTLKVRGVLDYDAIVGIDSNYVDNLGFVPTVEFQNSLVSSFYDFDGTNDIVTISDDVDIDFGTKNFSIIIRFRANDVNGTEYFLNKEASGTGYGIYKIDDDIYIRFVASAADASGIILTAKFVENIWYTLGITFDRDGDATAYLNNDTGTVDISSVSATVSNSGDLLIGSTTAGASFFDGSIDYVLFWNRLLSASEIALVSNWNSGNPPVCFNNVGANQVELASGWDFTSDWTEVSATVIDKDTYSSSVAGGIKTAAEFALTVGKYYEVKIAGLTSAASVTIGPATGTIYATGFGTHYFTATNTSLYIKNTSIGTTDITTLEVVQVGCVANYNSNEMATLLWHDNSGNDLDGTVSGATLTRDEDSVFDNVFVDGDNTTIGTVQAEHLKSTDDIEVAADILLSDGSEIGIAGNEIITFDGSGNAIKISGASFDVDGAATASSYASDGLITAFTLVISDSAFIDTLQFNTLYGLDSLHIDSLNFVPDDEYTIGMGGKADTALVGYLAQDETVIGDWLFDGVVTVSDSAFIDTLEFNTIYGLDSLNVDSLNFVPDDEYTIGMGGKADTALVGYLAQDETIAGNWVNTTSPWAENELVSTVIVESEINSESELEALTFQIWAESEIDTSKIGFIDQDETIIGDWLFDGVVTVSDSAFTDTLEYVVGYAGKLTATGTVQAEQLTSTDDALIEGQLTIGQSGTGSGQINWIASDNKQGTMAINTSDGLDIDGFTGGVSFDDNNILDVGQISIDELKADGGSVINVTDSTNFSDDVNIAGSLGIGTTSPDHLLSLSDGTDEFGWNIGNDKLYFVNDQPDTLMSLDSLGRLGVGTNEQYSKITVDGDIKFMPRKQQTLVTFVFDDSYAMVDTIMKPLFIDKGVPGVVATVSDNVGWLGGGDPYMDAEQLVALQDLGWEITSHAKTHTTLTSITEDSARVELRVSKNDLEAMGLHITNLAYPGGANNAAVRRIARDYYRAARAVEYAINPQILNTYELTSYNIDDHTLLARYDSIFDVAVAEEKWMIYHIHVPDSDDSTLVAALIDSIQLKNIPIVTINQALDSLGNILEVGDVFQVGETGTKLENLEISKGFGGVYDALTISNPLTSATTNRGSNIKWKGTGGVIYADLLARIKNSDDDTGELLLRTYNNGSLTTNLLLSYQGNTILGNTVDDGSGMRLQVNGGITGTYVGINTENPQHRLSIYSADPWAVLTDININLDVSSAAEAIDSASVFMEADVVPSIGMRGADGDADGWDLTINTDDEMLFTNAAKYVFDAPLDVTGAITVSGTVDGIDIATLLGATPGTATASVALIVDASKDINLDTGDLTTTDLTATGTISLVATSFNDGNLTDIGTIVVSTSDNHVIQGLSTGPSVERITYLGIVVGGNPGTNISVTDNSTSSTAYHSPTISNATNITTGGAADGSFSFSTTNLTMDITEVIIGVGFVSIVATDCEDSDATAVYAFSTDINSGNLIISAIKNGGNGSKVSWLDVLTHTGDGVYLKIQYWTST